ncbi:hypothetical protein F5Y19DRAFT_465732 [Xylariaceae sp. FL1651]|nr:hypothetical protein F5Y19DRAFT_465732 [Xylariaceae sp. FL1651]
MAIELQTCQAFATHEASYLHDPPSLRPSYLDTQLDFTNPSGIPQGTNSNWTSALRNMKALPQRPGPSGSRVVKRKSSIPRLGDGLLTIFTRDTALANIHGGTAHPSPEVHSALTSSNLGHIGGSTHPDDDVTFVDVLGQSIGSNLSRVSSCSEPFHDESTTPTTLTGDDSTFSSDDETTLDLLSSTSVYDKPLSSAESTPSPLYRLGDLRILEPPTARDKCQSPSVVTLISRSKADTRDQPHTIPHLADKLSDSFEHVPSILAGIEDVAIDEFVPDTSALYEIVKGFLSSEVQTESIASSTTVPQHSSTPTPSPPSPQRPFWTQDLIFEFYDKGVITLQRAKDTAKRHGYLDAYTVLEKLGNPLISREHYSHQTNVESISGSAKLPVEASQHRSSAATCRVSNSYRQCDIAYQTFALKLSKYSARDDSSGPPRPLHIFIDMSNIFIGFCDSWKISQSIPVHQFIRAPAFNFKIFTSIMERNRPATKKILAGSLATAVSDQARWPRHFIEAQAQGYKMNILNRVQKFSPIKVRRRRQTPPQATGVVYQADLLTSGDESTEDQARVGYETRNGEQGVDEILHLNMMDSVVDCIGEPASMILATGDAAQAEFSDGFLQYATRALEKGWKLELVTWKKTISSAWTNPAFKKQYGERFRIIYLDDFLNELNADLYPSLA